MHTLDDEGNLLSRSGSGRRARPGGAAARARRAAARCRRRGPPRPLGADDNLSPSHLAAAQRSISRPNDNEQRLCAAANERAVAAAESALIESAIRAARLHSRRGAGPLHSRARGEQRPSVRPRDSDTQGRYLAAARGEPPRAQISAARPESAPRNQSVPGGAARARRVQTAASAGGDAAHFLSGRRPPFPHKPLINSRASAVSVRCALRVFIGGAPPAERPRAPPPPPTNIVGGGGVLLLFRALVLLEASRRRQLPAREVRRAAPWRGGARHAAALCDKP